MFLNCHKKHKTCFFSSMAHTNTPIHIHIGVEWRRGGGRGHVLPQFGEKYFSGKCREKFGHFRANIM